MVQPQVGIDNAHAAADAPDGVSANVSIVAKAAAIPMLGAFLANLPTIIISRPPRLFRRSGRLRLGEAKAPGQFRNELLILVGMPEGETTRPALAAPRPLNRVARSPRRRCKSPARLTLPDKADVYASYVASLEGVPNESTNQNNLG
jgi:hypothetical protein